MDVKFKGPGSFLTQRWTLRAKGRKVIRIVCAARKVIKTGNAAHCFIAEAEAAVENFNVSAQGHAQRITNGQNGGIVLCEKSVVNAREVDTI